MSRTFSIITTSMGRIEHLKRSLPNMLAQPCNEVIVVDYSCPQGTGDYVRRHFPAARVVAVDQEVHFSNWKARNAGVSAATSDVLVFCDADTLLAKDAVEWLSENLPTNSFGCFRRKDGRQFRTSSSGLSINQLRGFHVVPLDAFQSISGYDEVLKGYAAGGDTDLEQRLGMLGLSLFPLNPAIIDSVVEHGDVDRLMRHADPVSISYGAGLLYREAKFAVLRLEKRMELPLATRTQMYETAIQVARALGPQSDKASLTLHLSRTPVLMPRVWGYEKGMQSLSLTVEVSLQNKFESNHNQTETRGLRSKP